VQGPLLEVGNGPEALELDLLPDPDGDDA